MPLIKVNQEYGTTTNLKILTLLKTFNRLEYALAEFSCRSCSAYDAAARRTPDVERRNQNVVEELEAVLRLARDFLTHQVGIGEFSDWNPVRCSCFFDVEDDLDEMVRDMVDFFETYPRSWSLAPRDEDDDEEDDKNSSKAVSRAFEEAYKKAGQHFATLSQVVRRCPESHPFLSSHCFYPWKGCRCCVPAKRAAAAAAQRQEQGEDVVG